MLDTFLAAADCGSFAQASEQLYISPVSVMKQINALESSLGITLFHRSPHGITLTAAGESVYRDAKRIMRLSASAIQRARAIQQGEQAEIRIGTSFLRPAELLMEYAHERGLSIENQFNFRLIPFDDNPENLQLTLRLLGQQIDCIMGAYGSYGWEKQYSVYKLGDTRLEVAMPREHPLAEKKSLAWADLRGETLMLVKKGTSLVADALRLELQQHHPEVTILDVADTYDINIFNECLRSGHLMQTLGIWRNIHPSLVTVPVEWDYVMPYGVITSRRPSERTKKLLQVLGFMSEEQA